MIYPRPPRLFLASLASLWLGSACSVEQSARFELPNPNGKDDTVFEIDRTLCPKGWQKRHAAPAAWTVMHYGAGDNNLDQDLFDDVNEMEEGLQEDSSRLNVIAFLDREEEQGVRVYRLVPDRNANKIAPQSLIASSDEEPDSGDWRTLAQFAKWTVTCYPADRYMLIISGHGEGWSSNLESIRPTDAGPTTEAGAASSLDAGHGISIDAGTRTADARSADTWHSMDSGSKGPKPRRYIAPDDPSGSSISTDQLADVLKRVRYATIRHGDAFHENRLVAYGSDACLMQTLEVAYEISGIRNSAGGPAHANYIIGSAETEPMEGWAYRPVIAELSRRPDHYATYPHQLFDRAAELYQVLHEDDDDGATLSVMSTGELADAMDAFRAISSSLVTLIEMERKLLPADKALAKDPTTVFGAVMQARLLSYSYNEYSEQSYTDLGQFLLQLKGQLEKVSPSSDWNSADQQHWRAALARLATSSNRLLQQIWGYWMVSITNSPQYEKGWGLSIYLPKEEQLCGNDWDFDDYWFDEFYKHSALAQDTDWDDVIRGLRWASCR